MRAYAYVLLATIDNLGYVSFEYTIDGKIQTLTITTDDATEFAGKDIKQCGATPLELQLLMEQSGLSNYGISIEQN